MKQQKIYTLIILLTTFSLFWENEKVITASVTNTFTSVNANDWLKDNFTEIKQEGVEVLTSELPSKVKVVLASLISTSQ